jgi:hypothetical protein
VTHDLLQLGRDHPNGGIFLAIEAGWKEAMQMRKHEYEQGKEILKGKKNPLGEAVLQKPRY